ncbi:MAG: CpsD/CapB family tyrosine-protein kinase [Acutalibacteraceae bacterium]
MGKHNNDRKKNINISSSEKFQIRESYNMARANITFTIIKEGCKKVVITSSIAGEGKSTFAVNLAISLAKQENTKVLLIDCDLRKSTIAKIFGFDSSPGLTDFITGRSEFSNVLHYTDISNLDVITSGVIPPNPSEILASGVMSDMLDVLSSKYDYIIMDTPPVNVVSDAVYCVKNADGTVLVAKELKTTHTELKKAVSSLKFINAKIIGIVLMGVEESGKTYKNKGKKYAYNDGYDYSHYRKNN